MILTASHIEISSVTDEQIGKCHKCFSGSTAFYMVESEQDSLIEYKVTWDADYGFRCTCKAGQYGFANCKAGICKHVRWSVAAACEEREAVAELDRAIAAQASTQAVKPFVPVLIIDGNADTATIKRVMSTPTKPANRAKANSPKGFSLLRV